VKKEIREKGSLKVMERRVERKDRMEGENRQVCVVL
jgi:hypothetical protein